MTEARSYSWYLDVLQLLSTGRTQGQMLGRLIISSWELQGIDSKSNRCQCSTSTFMTIIAHIYILPFAFVLVTTTGVYDRAVRRNLVVAESLSILQWNDKALTNISFRLSILSTPWQYQLYRSSIHWLPSAHCQLQLIDRQKFIK